MPFHEVFLKNVGASDVMACREERLAEAEAILKDVISWLNTIIKEKRLRLPIFPAAYDPCHESRWLYFFLRETIRNSLDAFLLEKAGSHEIKVTLASKDTGEMYLKEKDIGPGFEEMSAALAAIAAGKPKSPSSKDAKVFLGGKGFGLSLCCEKLPQVLFKNRKAGGACVKALLGESSVIIHPGAH